MKCRIKCNDCVAPTVYRAKKYAQAAIDSYRATWPERIFEIVDENGFPLVKSTTPKPVAFKVMWGRHRRLLGALGWMLIFETRDRKEAKAWIDGLNLSSIERRNYRIDPVY